MEDPNSTSNLLNYVLSRTPCLMSDSLEVESEHSRGDPTGTWTPTPGVRLGTSCISKTANQEGDLEVDGWDRDVSGLSTTESKPRSTYGRPRLMNKNEEEDVSWRRLIG